MNRCLLLCLLSLLSLPAWADGPWTWSAAQPLGVAGSGVFPHLDASGRKSLAVSAGSVALVWEDSRNGSPRCWLGWKAAGSHEFRETPFGQGECYSPSISVLDAGRFLLAWEDEAGVQAAVASAVASAGGVSRSLQLASEGGHASILAHPHLGVVAAWAQPDGRWRRVRLARLALSDGQLKLLGQQPADAQPPVDDQLYPVLAGTQRGLTLAWEDRRLGHTVIFAVSSADGQKWSAPARVSQNPTGKAQGYLGRGTGAMRPALVCFGEPDRLAAVWLDKRDFLSGYDVYAALEAGKVLGDFGANLKAQDSFGDAIAQWHATAAGNARGDLVVAFDDDRDGTADIWLSWWTGSGFADNLAPPPASGPGHQSDPVIALDEAGNLYLAWVVRDEDGSERIYYAEGVRPQTANSGSEKAR